MKKHNNNFNIVLLIVVMLLVSLACGGSNEGTIITPATKQSDQGGTTTIEVTKPEEIKPSFEVYDIGDVIKVKDHTIRLNSIKYQGTILVANFTVENGGSSDLSVSSILSFSAKNDDGTLLDQEIFDCGTSSLDGSILPGDKLRGDICWSGATPDDGIKIYYEASLLGQGAIVWNAVEGEAKDIDTEAGTPPQLETFMVGDLVKIHEHTIRLNSIEYQGTLLVADFTVENNGNSEVNMSTMVSFSAKNNDGVKLEQEYFDCGSSSLDGKVLPGDRLRGRICWAGANPDDGIKIYYEDDIFGEGAVVWDAIVSIATPLDITDAQIRVDVYKVSDVVQAQDHTIVLNSVEFQGNLLKANFTIENKGTSDVNISSMVSFYARNRDGYSLEQEYFDCGTSLDGSVIPGDKLRGDICWASASADDGIKIYYEAELFSEGAIVWDVD